MLSLLLYALAHTPFPWTLLITHVHFPPLSILFPVEWRQRYGTCVLNGVPEESGRTKDGEAWRVAWPNLHNDEGPRVREWGKGDGGGGTDICRSSPPRPRVDQVACRHYWRLGHSHLRSLGRTMSSPAPLKRPSEVGTGSESLDGRLSERESRFIVSKQPTESAYLLLRCEENSFPLLNLNCFV